MPGINRREILKLASLTCASGASLSFSDLALAVTAANKSTNSQFLGNKSISLLKDLVDIILPKTNTPSASEINVHIFIDYLVKNWMNKKEQDEFIYGLNKLALTAEENMGKKYFELTTGEKTELLSTIEMKLMAQKQKDSNPFDKAQSAGGQPFFKTLKQMTLIGYFTSSEGIAASLKHDPIPGRYQGCIPLLESDQSSYAGTFGDFGSLIEVK